MNLLFSSHGYIFFLLFFIFNMNDAFVINVIVVLHDETLTKTFQ